MTGQPANGKREREKERKELTSEEQGETEEPWENSEQTPKKGTCVQVKDACCCCCFVALFALEEKTNKVVVCNHNKEKEKEKY